MILFQFRFYNSTGNSSFYKGGRGVPLKCPCVNPTCPFHFKTSLHTFL